MSDHKTKSVLETGHRTRKGESGMALVVVLLLLLLVTAIGLGMVFMSNTESSINSNYRDSQLAFFAMRAGLEEVRDRMRSDAPAAWIITPPTLMPGPANANSILYITNPSGAADAVIPTSAGNAYFDDEFCHENFSPAIAYAPPAAGVPCTTGPPTGAVTYVNSISPHSNDGTGAALKYKWVRITLKQNQTFGNGVVTAYVDAGQPATTQICYQSASGQEIPLTLVPLAPVGGWASCTAAFAAGVDASPVYVVTALAITPNGSRRMGQYEMGSLNIQTPPVALGMDGPGATFSPAASSNNYFINGTDSGSAGFTASGGQGGCTPSGLNLPAITTGDQAGITNMFGNPPGSGGTIPVARQAGYTGGGIGPPSVSNGGGVGGAFNGEWSTPADLDNLVNSIASRANTTYPPSGQTCSVNGAGGSPCTPTGNKAGSVSPWNPQITYVNGDFDMGNASGAGILIVTGTLSFNGNASFNGLILVVGQGNMQESGGGNGGFNGSVFLAKTKSSASPYSELATLGSPTIGWNGGGNSFIQYNSCWANWGNQVRYTPIATREEMY
jgi:PilX N-terminal